MGIHYRSESSSSLTNEQIDDNFRILSENRSITGSYTLSGSLTPANPEFSLGSSEAPFHSLYLSDNLTVVSGSRSASMQTDLSVLQPPTHSTYPYLDLKGTPFIAPVLSRLENGEWFTAFAELTSSWYPIDTPQQGYLLPSPWFWVNQQLANNGGGMGMYYDIVTTGQKWLDRSRAYATDGVNLVATSSNESQGWWNNNSELSQAIIGKTPYIWDTEQPYLWHFSNETTFGTTFDQPTTYAKQNRKSSYFHLLTSGSALEDSSLEPPTYGDNDILVRMWNENVTQWSYWFTLEYNEDNVHYYNISESYDSNGYASFFQDSINPGRIHLANNYKGKRKKTYPNNPSDNQYDFEWDYNSSNPFISSSCLLLSLKTIAGPYVGNGDLNATQSNNFFGGASIQDGVGPVDSPTAYSLKLFTPNILVLSGSQSYPTLDWNNTGQYGRPTNLAKNSIYPNGSLAPPLSNPAVISKSYPYTPSQTNAVAGLNAKHNFTAYGYHQLQSISPLGTCAITTDSSKTGVQIMPLIPLTTAHYPVSASSFWYTGSFSGNILSFTKPNRSTFDITLPTSSTTLYSGDGVFLDDRTVDLNGYDLTFSASNGGEFIISADPGSQISITGLQSSSNAALLDYNITDGNLSTTNLFPPSPYFYSTGSTNTNAEVNNDIKLVLGEVYNYQNPNYLDLDDSIYRVNTAGKYYINVNGTLGQDDEPSSSGLGWWKISLQVNGTTVAESTAVQSRVGEHYGGLDLMYVGDFAIEDEIQVISNTSPPTSTSTISNTTYRFSAEYLNN